MKERYYLLWSDKEGNYWYDTDNIKELQNPLKQIAILRKEKKRGTKKPRIFKGAEMKITPKGDKFEISG